MIDQQQSLFAGARPLRIGTLCLLALVASLGGCGNDDDDSTSHACLDPLPTTCKPAFPPTFDNIFKQTLNKTCASSDTGSSCHYGPEPELAKAGLVLSDVDVAYDYLLGKADGRARVVPEDPECSLLIQRIESKDAGFRMPVGRDPLKDEVRCAIRQWIANGALRDGAARDGGMQ